MLLALEFIKYLETAFRLLLNLSQSGLVEEVPEEGQTIATPKDDGVELVFIVADICEILKNFGEVVLFLVHFEAGAEEICLYYFSAGVEVIGARADEALLFEDHSDDGVDGFGCYFLGVYILVVNSQAVEVGQLFLPGYVDG